MSSEKLNKIFVQLVKLWTVPVFRYGVKNGKFYAQVLPALEPGQGVDERIQRTGQAREHLVSGLSAIDELKQEPEANKVGKSPDTVPDIRKRNCRPRVKGNPKGRGFRYWHVPKSSRRSLSGPDRQRAPSGLRFRAYCFTHGNASMGQWPKTIAWFQV